MELLALIVTVAAITNLIGWLIADSEILRPLREALEGRGFETVDVVNEYGVTSGRVRTGIKDEMWSKVAYLVSCSKCLGFWIVGPVVAVVGELAYEIEYPGLVAGIVVATSALSLHVLVERWFCR